MMLHQETFRRQNKPSFKFLFTGMVTLFIFSFLLWEHFTGGVAQHHILQQKNLPAISNWWGGLLLPVLTWLLIGRTEKRIGQQFAQGNQWDNLQSQAVKLFITGLGIGILIAASFTNGYSLVLDNVPFVILILSLLIPIYYAEFMLGFILGMTYTFGAILPTIFILLFAAIGVLTYKFIRPLIMLLKVKISSSLNKSPNH